MIHLSGGIGGGCEVFVNLLFDVVFFLKLIIPEYVIGICWEIAL